MRQRLLGVGERTRMILTGMVTLTLLAALVVLGVKIAFGALDGGYELKGRFTAAGQGLIPDSDVKIRGVNVGEVKSIELDRGEAIVTLRINDGERVPVATRAVVRPKTLFGEKFVDLEVGDAEESGPFLSDGEFFEETLGGFELERLLADAYPILEAIDPEELMTVLATLADAGEDLGPVINRQIANFRRITAVNVEHDADMRQFLGDLALLSDELADRADDLVGTAVDLNEALPPLNARSEELAVVLDQLSRLSGDLADVLDANRPFLRKGIVEGGKALELLAENREEIGPLVTGLRQYVQTLTEVIRIPLEDGTLVAAVKGLLGSDAALIFAGAASPAVVPPGPAFGDAAPASPPPPLLPGPPITLPPLPGLPPTTVPSPDLPASPGQDLSEIVERLFE